MSNHELEALTIIFFLLAPGMLLCGIFGVILAGILRRKGIFASVLRGPWTGRLVGFLAGAVLGVFLTFLAFRFG